MILPFLQRMRNAWGRLFGAPAFLYEDSDAFLRRFVLSEWPEYAAWLRRNRLFTRSSVMHLYNQGKSFSRKPLISVIMPVYNPDPAELQQAVDSLLWQAYPHWELCIADDRSTNREYLRVLGRLKDRRIKIHLNRVHAGIAGTSQAALENARGEYIALMDQDDELYPDALFSFVQALQGEDIDYFYSDRDMISPTGSRYMHLMKPGWSPEFLLSYNYTCHFEIYKKSLVDAVGGFRSGYEGSQDYDLVLRATDQACRIHHHPSVLYSWRQSRGSVATNLDAKAYAFEAGVKAVRETARRRSLPVREVIENRELWRGHYRLLWDEEVLASREITFLAIGASDEETGRITTLLKECAADFPKAVFRAVRPCSAAIRAQVNTLPDGGTVFFCDNSVVAVKTPALADMIGYLGIPGVGVVGCKFLDDQGTTFNAGLAITGSGNALFAYRGKPAEDPGYGAVAAVPRNVSAVFPAFWGAHVEGLRKQWPAERQGGYYSAAFQYFKETLRDAGRIVCIPYMCMQIAHERLNYEEDMKMFLKDWQAEGLSDRYYSPNLSDAVEDFGLQS